MIYGYGLRKRGHVLRARDGSAKQDVRVTRTLGVKFPGIAPSRPGEEPCCGNKDLPHRAVFMHIAGTSIDDDLTNIMHEPQTLRMTHVSLFAKLREFDRKSFGPLSI